MYYAYLNDVTCHNALGVHLANIYLTHEDTLVFVLVVFYYTQSRPHDQPIVCSLIDRPHRSLNVLQIYPSDCLRAFLILNLSSKYNHQIVLPFF
jgi:hypothetical protein